MMEIKGTRLRGADHAAGIVAARDWRHRMRPHFDALYGVEDDLRQGVTPTQHAVLDMIEQQGAEWGDLYDFETQLQQGWDRARMASRVSLLSKKRSLAIEAAARLIDAADEIGRMIQIDGEC